MVALTHGVCFLFFLKELLMLWLSSVGIGGSLLSILTQFLSNRSQHVMVNGSRGKLVNIVAGVPQGRSVLGPLLFLLYTSELFFHSGKKADRLCR